MAASLTRGDLFTGRRQRKCQTAHNSTLQQTRSPAAAEMPARTPSGGPTSLFVLPTGSGRAVQQPPPPVSLQLHGGAAEPVAVAVTDTADAVLLPELSVTDAAVSEALRLRLGDADGDERGVDVAVQDGVVELLLDADRLGVAVADGVRDSVRERDGVRV